MEVNREEFLRILEMVKPAVSRKPTVEQSTCFAFLNKEVITYDGNLAMRHPTELDFEGAVYAEALVKWLGRVGEEEVDISAEGERLLLKGKGRGAKFKLQNQVLLPIGQVEKPGKWVSLPDEFSEALQMVQACAGGDVQFTMSCVHFHPKWLEAYEQHQMIRYRMQVPEITESILVRRDSVKHAAQMGITEVSITGGWIHFRNPSGLVLSCRRLFEGKFPDLSNFFKVEGETSKLILPKGLAEAAARCEVFSEENKDFNRVIVELKPGKLRIRGLGTSGEGWEVKDVKYSGKPLSFLIDPELLKSIVQAHNDCILTEGRLMVDGGKFRYSAALGKPPKE